MEEPFTTEQMALVKELLQNLDELSHKVEVGVAAAIERQMPDIVAAMEPAIEKAVREVDAEIGPEITDMAERTLKESLEPLEKRLTRLESLVFRALRMQ